MARALGCNHQHIQITARFNQLEVNVESVSKGDGRIFFQVRLDLFSI